MLPIVEKFASIQGENFEAGTPSIFIRVGGCILSCPWCDSKYASRSGFKAKFELNTKEEVSEFVKLVATAPENEIPITHAVITGGEPMMTEYIPHIQQIIYDLWNNYYIDTTIETTMCVEPDDVKNEDKTFVDNIHDFLFSYMDRYAIDEVPHYIKFSVSPKLDADCYKVENVNFFHIEDFYRLKSLHPKLNEIKVINQIFMKIVYKDELTYHETIARFRRAWPPTLVQTHFCLMPYTPMHPNEWKQWNANTFISAYNRSCQQTAKFCKEQNIHYSPRLHIDLWGLKRGV